MAIAWLTVLKAVPWTEVINNAPKIADGAKKLWRTVAKSPPQPEPYTTASKATAYPGGASLAELERRLDTTEATVSALHNQMLASVEIIKAITEQNTRLIERIESNRIRTLWLAVATAVAVMVAGVSLAITLTRHVG